MVKTFIRYFEAIAEQQRKLADSLQKNTKDLASPRESSALSIFGSNETLQVHQ